MLCQKCGAYITSQEIACPVCGAPVQKQADETESAIYRIRQGRRGRETMPKPEKSSEQKENRRARRPDASHSYDPDTTSTEELPVYGLESTGNTGMDRFFRRSEHDDTAPGKDAPKQPNMRKHGKQTHKVKQHMINWVHVAILIMVLIILMLVGAYMYLTRTSGGQRIMARMGQDATSQAMWQVGEEYLNNGNIEKAVSLFEQARAKDDESEEVNVDGLLLLGTAYESENQLDKAEELYTELYTDIVPTRSEPYRYMINILIAEDRGPEAADLMKLAYEKTGQSTFLNERTELLPAAPEVDIVAGNYSEQKTLHLTSSGDYDIYYTFDENAVLPDEGKLYTEPIVLDEGTYSLRAVAVNGKLVSDELTGTWRVVMPSPGTPGCSLAPNTYKTSQRVWLRVNENNKDDDDIIIYYTIDGSTPDQDSPVYDGNPIYLPNGRVTIRAVAVNGYGKSSNVMEILYKIEAKPWPLTKYSTDDDIGSMKLYYTSQSSFRNTYGKENSSEEYVLDGVSAACIKCTYDWGYAVFMRKSSDYVLAELYFTSSRFSGPRGTGVGMTDTAIIGEFRDMKQVASPSGNRGLYCDDEDIGKLYAQEDGSELISYQAETSDSQYWHLDYHINKSGICDSIDWRLEQ